MKKSIVFSVLAVLIFAAGFLSGSIFTGMKLAGFPLDRFIKEVLNRRITEMGDADSEITHSFWESIHWGGLLRSSDGLETLPDGEGVLKGRMVLEDGEPVEGVTCFLTMNGRFKTKMMKTDKEGFFHANLPPGAHYINTLECREWVNRPGGEFDLFSGEEPGYDPNSFNRLFYPLTVKGKKVVVANSQDAPVHLAITIKKRVYVVWPDSEEERQPATIKNSEIKWQTYAGAKKYLLKISKLTPKGPNTKTITPVLYRLVEEASSLKMESLPHKRGDQSEDEYTVEIIAFDRDDNYLSSTGHPLGSFVFTDGFVLQEEEEASLDDYDSISEEMEKEYERQKMANAIEYLIKGKMYNEAKALLDTINEENLSAEKALLQGYYYASTGNCDEAAKQFEKARGLGRSCIPGSYKVGCL